MNERWFYGRVSSIEQQEDRDALKKQLERGKNAGCRRFYWDIQSRTTEVRDGLQQLINDLKAVSKDRVRDLVVTRIDRIGSSSKLFYSLMEVLRSQNIKLIALDQTIDTESLGGELTVDILLAASKFEIKMLSSRVSAERKHRMAQRKSHRFAPLGWKVFKDSYVKDESWCICLLEEKQCFRVWELALFVFEVFNQCGSVRKTCDTLNKMFGTCSKVESRINKKNRKQVIDRDNLDKADFSSNKKNTFKRYPWGSLQWSPSGLKNFLVNPVNAGGTPFNVTTKSPSGKQLNHFDKWDCNWDTHKGIITRERHEQVKRIIRSNANNRWVGSKKVNPFANLLKCSNCGGALTRTSGQLKRGGKFIHYYQCNYFPLGRCDRKEMIRSDKLDEQVTNLLVKEATRLSGMVNLEAEKGDEPGEVKELRETLAGLEKLPVNTFVEKAKYGIREQIAQIISLNEQFTTSSLVVREELSQMFCDREFWDTRNSDDKKRILNRFVSRIIIDRRLVSGIEFL